MQPVHFRRRYGNQRMQQKDYRPRHRPQHRQRGRQGSRATVCSRTGRQPNTPIKFAKSTSIFAFRLFVAQRFVGNAFG